MTSDTAATDAGSGAPQDHPTPPRVRVDVDNTACHLFGICQHEAPAVFDLGADGRLRYDPRPPAAASAAVRQAARCCPMQAITARTATR